MGRMKSKKSRKRKRKVSGKEGGVGNLKGVGVCGCRKASVVMLSKVWMEDADHFQVLEGGDTLNLGQVFEFEGQGRV